MKVDIGSGNNPKAGYVAYDMDSNADIQGDMRRLPFANGSIDAIHSSHALEHLSKFEIVPTLREWARVLKVGGCIEILVPDLVWCVNRWLRTQGDGWDMAVIFGSQTQDGAHIHPGEFHKTGFTEGLMRGYLMQAGLQIDLFERIWTHEQETMRFMVRK